MRRKHGLLLSLLLGAAATAGVYAAMQTTSLGATVADSDTVSDSIVAQRKARLDRWAASLAKALRENPPELPPIPRYDPVQTVASPAWSPLPELPDTQFAMPAPQTPPGGLGVAATTAAGPAAPPAATPAPSDPSVRYVKPPPIVRYVQRPAAADPSTQRPLAEEHEHEDKEHAEEHEDEGHEWGSTHEDER